jgi:hypothetical protein
MSVCSSILKLCSDNERIMEIVALEDDYTSESASQLKDC